MKKVIIFGAGFYGEIAYFKLKNDAEILYYVDNDLSKVGNKLHGIEIISSMQLKNIYDENTMDIVISPLCYTEIACQINQMGIRNYYVFLEGMLYYTDTMGAMIPHEEKRVVYHEKKQDEKNILFVQDTACIRTHKIASLMKESGYKVFLLYTVEPPEYHNSSFLHVYDKVFTFYSYKSMIDFVENSQFDIVHSSNTPDTLTCLLLNTSKHIVFDTHDMHSLNEHSSNENLVLELIANTKSDGNMYTSKDVMEIAKQKYGLDGKELFFLENIILDQEEVGEPYSKLSWSDHEIHCVYEGSINVDDANHHRYFEPIWMKIAEVGIHIHFYSHSNATFCRNLEQKNPYFHYEGNMGSKELAQEMTKYDCGLVLFNINVRNRCYLETARQNKIYEYLNAQLPVVVGDIKYYTDFVQKYDVGISLDLDGDIKEQFKKVCEIKIDKNFLRKNNLTMRAHRNELVEFYEKVKKKVISR